MGYLSVGMYINLLNGCSYYFPIFREVLHWYSNTPSTLKKKIQPPATQDSSISNSEATT